MQKEIVKVAQDLVAFRSTRENPTDMRACLQYCVDFFEGFAVSVQRYEHNGVESVVIANTDTVTPDILILGHIDVADGPDRLFKTRVENGKLYGRGTSDMKAFVATSLIVARGLFQEKIQKKIALAIVTDEELGGKDGTGYLVDTIGYRPRVVLVPDDGDHIGTIVTKSKHVFTFLFSAQGKSAHGNRPWDGVNAVELLIHTWQNLKKAISTPKEQPPSNWINTVNLGVMRGGLASNEVPSEASMKVDIRIVPPTTRQDIFDVVQHAVPRGVVSELLMEGYPTTIAPENPYFLAYGASIKKITGITGITHKQSGGGTDARYFSAHDILVIVHQGTCGDAQGENEYVEIESLNQLVAIQTDFIRSLKPE